MKNVRIKLTTFLQIINKKLNFSTLAKESLQKFALFIF